MANHKSAAKRARQTITKNLRNRSYRASVRTAVKKLYEGYAELEAGKTSKEDVAKLFSTAQSALMKSVTKGLTHKNTASRKIKRLSAAFKKIATK